MRNSRDPSTLERRCARLAWGVRAAFGLWALTLVAVVAMGVRGGDAQGKGADPVDVLRVHRLEVVDGNGVTRVILGAPLPEPIILGRRHPRGGAVSGMLILDGEGNERGGYVTDDGYGNAMITLDSVGRMQWIGMVEPDGGAWTNLSAADGSQFDVRVSEGGAAARVVEGGKEVWKSGEEK